MIRENLQKLKKISKLDENWNGYGASPIPENIIENTEQIIRACKYHIGIFPTADGTIQLECEKDNGDYLEIEISDKAYYETFKITSERINGCEGTIEKSTNSVIETITNFYLGKSA